MSLSLTTNALAQFDAEVKQAYQGMGKLRPSVRLRTGVVGSTHQFPKIGKGSAQQRTPQTDVTPMNVVHSNAIATLTDWCAPEYTDIFNQATVNYDERQQLAGVIAGAIGRREDQLILNALDAASSTLTIPDSIGGTSSGLNTAKVRRAKRLLDAQGVDSMDRTFTLSAYGLEQLLGDGDANTVDKNVIKALYDGEIKKWVGFDFVVIEDRTEGGLPLSSTARTGYAYHKSAVGMAIGIEFRTEVNYIPEKTSWLSNGLFKGGSVGIDALGIVEYVTYEV